MTLQSDLRTAGYENDILVSTSFGGVMHLADVVQKPIFLVKSGPAMAPVAGLAYVDITTGEFRTAQMGESELAAELGRLSPMEVLAPEGQPRYSRSGRTRSVRARSPARYGV